MRAYVVSRMNGTHPRGARVPRLYDYMGNFEVKADAGDWAVVIVDDAAEIPPAAEADPDIFVFDTEAELDTVLSNPKRNAVNDVFLTTGWQIGGVGITADAGATVRIVLDTIRQAMGHSAASWGLGL